MKKSCTINGVCYESGKAASDALGIPLGTLRNRLISHGFPEYRSRHHPKRDFGGTYRLCSIAGVEYRSIASACRELELSPYKIKTRLASLDYPDYVCADIPKKPSVPRKGKGYPCTIDGIDYDSEQAAADALGCYTSGLRIRLQSSNFPEYVSKHRPKKERRTFVSCSVAGVEYRSIGDAAREAGVHYREMVRRLVSPDYPDYVCDKRPKRFPKHVFMVNGRKYFTLQEIADVEGLTRERIRQKVNDPSYVHYRRLLPSDLPAPKPERKFGKAKDESCGVAGVAYESRHAVAEASGGVRHHLR